MYYQFYQIFASIDVSEIFQTLVGYGNHQASLNCIFDIFHVSLYEELSIQERIYYNFTIVNDHPDELMVLEWTYCIPEIIFSYSSFPTGTILKFS